MSRWAHHHDAAGWNLGFYPASDYDWQLSLLRIRAIPRGGETFLDVSFGKRNDWRFGYRNATEGALWRPRSERLNPPRRFWRFEARNYAKDEP